MNTKITLDEWLQQSVIEPNTKPENSFTIPEILAKSNINRRTLMTRLDNLIHDGKLKKGKCVIDGKILNYYVPIELDEIHNNQNERPQNESKRTNGRAATKIHSRVRKQAKGRARGITKAK